VDHTEVQGLFAIDVPPHGEVRSLYAALEQGKAEGLWDYQEGNVTAEHDLMLHGVDGDQ
jgi:hypothetical protein